ncbi:MFS transporter [Alteromonadaceae bacterium M269]|nr:MFS transporter [Alteromonadaceae bacterium M269]
MSPPPQKSSGFFANLIFNIAVPTLILTKLSGPEYLGPVWSIVVALSFPIGYGLWDLKQSGKVNGFSILGIISVFLTGGISLLKLDPQYIAIKEAAIPAVIGVGVFFTQNTKYSVVKILILNEQLLRLDLLKQALEEANNTALFEKKMKIATTIIASSFFLSSVLNYVLAKVILVSPPGTTEYSQELGKMTALSYPVIMVPSMIILIAAMWYLFSQIKKCTGKGFDSFMVEEN